MNLPVGAPRPDGLALPARPWPAWPGRQVPIGGRSLFVRRTPLRGEGPHEPAVFVHGLGGSSTNWTDLAGLLAGRLDVWAPDLPGFGRSDPSTGHRYPLDVHVRAVARLVEHRGEGPVHLAGNSLGGAVAVRLAAERPDLVRSLTLVSPALPDLRVRRLDPLLPVALLPGLGRLAMRRLAAATPERRARRTVALCFADPSRVAPQRLREAADEVARRSALGYADDAFAGSLRGLVRTQLEPGHRGLWRQLAAVAVPSLVVWGVADRLVNVRVAPRAARVLRDSRLLVLDRCGHVPQMEAPYDVAAAVLDLLDATVAASPI